MNFAKNTFKILFAAAILAFGNFAINPNRPDLSLKCDEITLTEIGNLPKNLIILDARRAKEFTIGHIKGALNLSEEEFDVQFELFLEKWKPNMAIVIYCNNKQCNSSRIVADRLKNEYQINNIFILKDDWRKWGKPCKE